MEQIWFDLASGTWGAAKDLIIVEASNREIVALGEAGDSSNIAWAKRLPTVGTKHIQVRSNG